MAKNTLRAAIVVLLAVGLSRSLAGLAAPPSALVTECHFPDRLLGSIYYYDKNRKRISIRLKGAVLIPKNVAFEFFPNLDGAMQPDAMDALPADQISELHCNDLEMDDSVMAKWSRFSKLKYLNLSATDITDKSAQFIARMPDLARLDVSRTFLTEKSLPQLSKLKKLVSLVLESDKLGAGAGKSLSPLTELCNLRLGISGFSDAEVKDLGVLPHLNCLALGQNPKVTNQSIPYFLKLKNLQVLELHDTGVTAAGLCKLKSLPKLVSLKFRKRRLTSSDLAMLAKDLPRVTIIDPSESSNVPMDVLGPIH